MAAETYEHETVASDTIVADKTRLNRKALGIIIIDRFQGVHVCIAMGN